MARLKPNEEKRLRELAEREPKVAEQLKKHDQLTNQLADFLAQQKAESRKNRNRELMIIGSCVFNEAESNNAFREGLKKLLNRHAKRQVDRKFLTTRGWEIEYEQAEFKNTISTNTPISE